MTKHINFSDRDSTTLRRLAQQQAPQSLEQPESYENRVVVKPWGYEFLLFENKHTAVWYLHLTFEQATSMHCHPKKKTSLVALAGKALCNTFHRRYYVDALDAVIIEKGVFHSTKCLSPEGLSLIEIETPPLKTDLVRLSDEYGRQSFGYEGLSEMKTDNLDKYGYARFTDPRSVGPQLLTVGTSELSLHYFKDADSFHSGFRPSIGEFYCSCGGKILDVENNIVLDTGDAHDGEYLDSFKELNVADEIILLRLRQLGENL